MMMNNYLGENIKKLGFGLMRPPFISTDGDIDKMKEMVDAYMEKGFSYFDTSAVYGQGVSEQHAKDILVKRYPRDSFQFATKLPLWTLNSKEDMQLCLDASLDRVGVDYFDFYLLHGVNGAVSDRFPNSSIARIDDFGAWDFMKRAKAEGKAKHIGLSFHDSAEVLDLLLTKHPEMEFVQLQINYADWEDEVIQARKCYDIAIKHETPVIIMEPLKGGTLLKLRPEVEEIFREANPDMPLASWAIRYCASLEGVITVLSGMQSIEVVMENLSYMNEFMSLSKDEMAVLDRVSAVLQDIDNIGCTGCGYCVDDCPQKINIPKAMELLNDYRVFNDLTYSKRRYGNGMAGHGIASDCIACGACESHCPQKLNITGHLEEAAKLFE